MNLAETSMGDMSSQLSLPGLCPETEWLKLDAPRARRGQLLGYNLFLAIVPPRSDARHLDHVARGLRQRLGLVGECLPAERLHITLLGLAYFPDRVPTLFIDAACAAAARVHHPPLPIVFDRVMGFATSRATVLRCTPCSDTGIARLRQSLQSELRRVGIRAQQTTTPHMTILYDHCAVGPHAIEPVCWRAERYALILSHQGVTHHQWVSEWALGDRS